MKISVIIPVYNVAKYLSECVESVRSQTYKNIEIILVNDGSTDLCPEICDDFSLKDKRVKVIHKENGGLADARNVGMLHVTGDYILFLDADDFWDDRKAVEKLVKRAKTTKPDVLNYLYKKYYKDREEKKTYNAGKDMPLQLERTNEQLEYLMKHNLYIASACNKMIRADLLREGELLFKKGKVSEDIEWCARLMAMSKRFDYVGECFYCYRQRTTSITHTFSSRSCRDLVFNVWECIKIAKQSNSKIRVFLYQYAAYQFSTFFAVQALAQKCSPGCYKIMDNLSGILRYHGNNKKVTILYILTRVLGFEKLCWIIRKTTKIWKR